MKLTRAKVKISGNVINTIPGLMETAMKNLIFSSSRNISSSLNLESVSTVTPIANVAYKEGREAYLAGIKRSDNPYLSDLSDISYLWSAADIWYMGWDFEESRK